MPLAKQLHDMGISLTVRDKKSPEELGEDALELLQNGVRFVWGNDCFDTLTSDVIFRSPGIRPDYKGIKNAVANGAELTSEMELFLELTPAKILAVTGSDGKTTTTTLIHHILKEEGYNCYLGGNIGTPLFAEIDKMREMLKSIDFTILEEKDKVTAIKNVASTVSMIPKLVKELADAEKAVTKEIEEQGRARGTSKRSVFEDGISL